MAVTVSNLRGRLKRALTLGAAIVTCMSLFSPALAASSGQAVSSASAQTGGSFDLQKLSTAEKVYFGSSFEQMPVEQRMDKLERGVFGHNRSGSLDKRFDRLTAALGPDKFVGPKAAEPAKDNVAASTEQKAEDQPEKTSETKSETKSAPKAEVKADAKPEAKPESKTELKPESKTASGDQPAQPSTDPRVQGLLKAGMSAHKSGQIQIAEGHFKSALAIDPRCADAFYNLGSIAESRGDLLSALTNYRAALGINPLEREFQNAVKAVEDDVAKGHGTIGSASATANNSMPKAAPPFARNGYYPGATYAGTAPANYNNSSTSADNKLFNLQTAQSNALMQAQGNYPVGNVYQPPMPVYNVSQQSAPTLNVGQQKPPSHNNAAANAMVNVLMQASGLHCPICRLRSLGSW